MDSESLLRRSDHIPGVFDYLGRPACRSSSGRWTSAAFIIGVEIAERFAYCGVSLNLITYLTGPLRQSTASAAAALNFWTGVASMLPLLGAFIADSYLGRYRTIVISSILYVLGLGMLTLSTVSPSLRPPDCGADDASESCEPSSFQVAFFYFCLYIVGFAQGGHKPCVQAFGADQFDENDEEENKSRSSFFNWWYFGMCGGILVGLLLLSYIQENVNWSLGFAIPSFVLILALVIFLIGTKTYRFYPLEDQSQFSQLSNRLWAMLRKEGTGRQDAKHSASIKADEYLADANRAEDTGGLLRLFPLWSSCLAYGVVFAQSSTLFVKQGSTLDRSITSSIQVPAAALQGFTYFSVVVLIPIYVQIFLRIARTYTKLPSGITMLQRIGAGLAISTVMMVIAALVETKRLKTAEEFGLVDQPFAVIPMSLWWLVPQFILLGASMVLSFVGLQEFFYDQVPDALRSLGLGLYLSIFGAGYFISSILISIIDLWTRSGESWFSDNMNKGHLDYFYWLLAGLSALGFLCFLYFAQVYTYKISAAKGMQTKS